MFFLRSNPSDAAKEIAAAINTASQQGSVLWLLSGGSNIDLAVDIQKQLSDQKISVGLIDERFGAVGHSHSNWKQLIDAGFDFESVIAIPVLQGQNTKEEAASEYAAKLQDALTSANSVITIFGMGQDGHTSGILPNSPAVSSEDLVTAYTGPDYERVTTTFKLFPYINQAFLVSFGQSKREQIIKLETGADINIQPAQGLKEIPNLTVMYDADLEPNE